MTAYSKVIHLFLSRHSETEYEAARGRKIALLPDARQSFVRPDCCVLKLPRLLPGWRRTLPHELPRESLRKRSRYDVRGLLGEVWVQFGGFRESTAIQLRVDLNRLHGTIITPSVNTALAQRVLRLAR